MPIMRRAAAALMTSPMIFGHRTGKAVRKARDIPDLPVLETGGNHGGLVYADISALVRLLVRSARQAKIDELLKIERHRRLHGWDGTDRLTSRRGAAARPPDSWV